MEITYFQNFESLIKLQHAKKNELGNNNKHLRKIFDKNSTYDTISQMTKSRSYILFVIIRQYILLTGFVYKFFLTFGTNIRIYKIDLAKYAIRSKFISRIKRTIASLQIAFNTSFTADLSFEKISVTFSLYFFYDWIIPSCMHSSRKYTIFSVEKEVKKSR